MAFFKGFLTGLGTIIFIGPVLFTLLKASLQYGRKAGLAVAIGIIISDIAAVAICLAGSTLLHAHPEYRLYIGLLAAAMLLVMGIKYLVQPGTSLFELINITSTHTTIFLIKGFLVNFVNPFVFVVWLGIIAYGSQQYGMGNTLLLYLAGCLAGIFFLDATRALLAEQITRFLTPKHLSHVYRAIGVLLIFFGIRILWVVL
ncbi:MAG: LysE family transporter [Chitinophagales bacterium]|nr:LysE family transporter [Chitinophagales bacterium]